MMKTTLFALYPLAHHLLSAVIESYVTCRDTPSQAMCVALYALGNALDQVTPENEEKALSPI